MSASRLIREALRQVDTETLARRVGVSANTVERWSTGEEAMTFIEKVGATMAVITLAPIGSELLRHAATLRNQLAASMALELGTTAASVEAPHLRFDLK